MTAPLPHAAVLAEHAAVTPELARRADELTAALARWLADAGIKAHSITACVKDRASLAAKLARPDRSYRTLWDVTDLLGLRVVTYFHDAVDEVARVIERRLPIDLARSIDKRRGAPGAFGYRSLHYVFALDDAGGLPAGARGELQIRTALEHAWAEIEHDLGYKAPGAVPSTIRHRLSRLAGLLEIADREFVAVRDELAGYAAALPERIAADAAVALDELAIRALAACPEAAALDAALATTLGRAPGDEVFYPDYLLRMLQHVGLATAAEVRAGLRRHADTIVAIAPAYFQFAWASWRVAPTQHGCLLRGYALFLLAYAHLLDGATLQLDRVERLARLYRALDYPDDPIVAQRVASGLVAALARDAVAAVA